jgi:endo-1,4-beta-xylanase
MSNTQTTSNTQLSASITPTHNEVYTFTVKTENPVTLWVNGVRLIHDAAPSPHPRCGKLRLEANQTYAITVVCETAPLLEYHSSSQHKETISLQQLDPKGLARGLPENAPLRVLADARGMLIGGVLQAAPLRDEPLYAQVAAREFNMLSSEGSFLIGTMHDEADPFKLKEDLTDLDEQVQFAQEHQQAIQAFHLVWAMESAWAPWLNTLPKERRYDFMRKRIHDVMTRYKGKVSHYNVVNEAFNDEGLIRQATIKFGGEPKENWLHGLGEGYEYIEVAFKEARKADPSAKLFYNDYGLERGGPKWEAVLEMVEEFKSRNIPIDGVGFQGHMALKWTIPDPQILAKHFRQLHKLGLEVRVTEFDYQIAGDNEHVSGPEAPRLLKQAEDYKAFMNVCLNAPNCTAFQLWGFTDKHSWLTRPGKWGGIPENKPLIFDEAYQPKAAYYALRDALLGR